MKHNVVISPGPHNNLHVYNNLQQPMFLDFKRKLKDPEKTHVEL